MKRELVAVWVGEVKSPTFLTNSESALCGTRVRRRKQGTSGPERRGRERSPRTMDITWLTDRLAVGGGIWNSENMGTIARSGITHIIDMQIEFDDTPLAARHGIKVLWNPTDDDFELKPAELFRRGVEFARVALDDVESKLFIHCAAGVHRAPMMALAVLVSIGWKLEDAKDLIEGKRPAADLAEIYVQSVKSFLDGQSD